MLRVPEHIDQYFRRSLENFEADPDVSVWDIISVKLERKRKRRFVMLVTRIAAGIAVLCALGISIYFYGSRSGKSIANLESRTVPATVSETESAAASETRTASGSGTESETASETGSVGSIETGSGLTSSSSTDIYTAKIPPGKQSGPEKPVPADRFQNEESTVSTVAELHPERSGISGKTKEIVHSKSDEVSDEESAITRKLTLIEGIALESVLFSDQIADLASFPVQRTLDHSRTDAYENGFVVPSESEDSRKSAWNLSGEFAPVYSYRRIFSDYLDQQQLDDMNEAEKGLLTYAGGIGITYSVNDRFSIQSGMHYSRYGQEKERISYFRSDEDSYSNTTDESSSGVIRILNSTGSISSTSSSVNTDDVHLPVFGTSSMNTGESNLSAIQYFDFLELPVILKYKLIDRKLDFRILGGMVTNLMVGNRVYLKQDGTLDLLGKTGDVRRISYAGMFGLGFEYPLFGLFTWNLEPRFQYYLNPIDKTPQIDVHPYSFGIFTGLSYTF